MADNKKPAPAKPAPAKPAVAKEKKLQGIALKSERDLNELKDTLAENPHIEEVYFGADGRHYFVMHELKEKGKATGKFYGFLKVVDVVAKVIGERRIYKKQSVHTPASLIVETMTAEQVMDYEFVDHGQTDLLTPANKRKAAKAAMETDGDINDPSLPTRKAINQTLSQKQEETSAELI